MPRIKEFPDLPSVTEILAAVGLTRSYEGVAPHYAQLGTALHLAIHLHTRGELEVASLHPEVRPGFDAFLEFEARERLVVIHSELALVHPQGFVGHLDLVASVGDVERAIIDIKYSDAPDIKGATYQLAGYGLLHDHAYPETPAEERYVLPLSKKGKRAELVRVTDAYSKQIFLAALIVERAKREG